MVDIPIDILKLEQLCQQVPDIIVDIQIIRHGYYSPDTNTQKLMDIIYANQSAIKEILCGHLHFTWDGPVTENTHEHIFSPAFEKKIGVINVKGK